MDTSPFRVALISMPWAIFNRPSIQLGSLKSYLEQDKGIEVDTFHPYLNIAKAIGIETYSSISRDSWAGEALFAPQLFPEITQDSQSLFHTCGPELKKHKLNFDELLFTLKHTLEEWLTTLQLEKYDLVGLSLCFSQLFPSLVAATSIKAQRGDIPIVMGGNACAGAMGTSLLHTFSQIDYVIDGEGEVPLLQLCHYLSARTSHFPARVTGRGKQVREINGGCIEDINTLPVPNYSSYFQEVEKLFPGQPFLPILPIEFSRGCWWNKCAFCNLNIQWSGYRWKNAARTLKEVKELSQSYKSLDFTFTDNALPPKEADTFFKMLATEKSDLRFFAEIRLITEAEKISLYHRGGLTRVQVGIEALSSSLLQKLDKGTHTIENIAAMKHCAEKQVQLEGNLIIEFPGSTEDEVEETLDNISYVFPYHPLSTASFFLGMGSPIADNPDKYSIMGVGNHSKYKKLFPKTYLSQLELLVKDYRYDRQKQRKIWKRVKDKTTEWKQFHNNRADRSFPPLSYRDGGTFLIIRQEQPGGETLIHRLQGLSRKLYLYCSTLRTLEEIEQAFTSLPQKTILNFFGDLSKKRLLFQEKKRVLALAIKASSSYSL